MSIFQHYQSRYDEAQEECYSIQDFLSLCQKDQTGLRKCITTIA